MGFDQPYGTRMNSSVKRTLVVPLVIFVLLDWIETLGKGCSCSRGRALRESRIAAFRCWTLVCRCEAGFELFWALYG